jgi:hypothetical protein
VNRPWPAASPAAEHGDRDRLAVRLFS